MKYDDASWHYGGDFPDDLPDEAGATHIAMFAAWAVLNELAGDYHTAESTDELSELAKRQVSPGEWFWRVSDGKLTDQDLSEAGNRFASYYYGRDGQVRSDEGSFLADYDATFADTASLYHVPDTWTSYDALSPKIDQRYRAWLRSH
jgi:hypothetical protein